MISCEMRPARTYFLACLFKIIYNFLKLHPFSHIIKFKGFNNYLIIRYVILYTKKGRKTPSKSLLFIYESVGIRYLVLHCIGVHFGIVNDMDGRTIFAPRMASNQ